MKRRKFIQLSGPLAFTPVFFKNNFVRPFLTPTLTRFFACEGVNDRVLVVVQIKGGNDGLNCVIPMNQYDMYKSFRPKIGIAETDLVNIDTGLPLENQIGLHPELGLFKAMYELDELAVIQAVGYANNNKSHFKGTDTWLSGGDATPEYNNLTSGWVGRYLDHSYPGLAGNPTVDNPDPLGIQLGSKQQSLGFHTEDQHEAGINLSGQDPAGFYSFVSEIGGLPPTNIPASDYATNIEYIVDIEKSTSKYAQRVSDVFNAGKNMANYPDYDLANQFKTVARLMSGGIKTKVFIVTIGGFDTHVSQAEESDPKTGKHAELLKQLSASIVAFQQDINELGLADRMMGVTFSEFGRRPKENENAGTDHGTVAPMFLFGKHVKTQVLGTNVDLSLVAQDDNDLVGLQTDYRSVFTSLIQDWLGASNTIVTNTLFEDFLDKKAPVVTTDAVVNPECYIDTYLATNVMSRTTGMNVYPNPAENFIRFRLEYPRSTKAYLHVTDMSGKQIMNYQESIIQGVNDFELPTVHLIPGNYILNIQVTDSRNTYQAKFVKI